MQLPELAPACSPGSQSDQPVQPQLWKPCHFKLVRLDDRDGDHVGDRRYTWRDSDHRDQVPDFGLEGDECLQATPDGDVHLHRLVREWGHADLRTEELGT